MWLTLAFLSAALLGFYDSFKKKALQQNAVIPVLFLNTVFCSLIFLPFIFLSSETNILDGSLFYVASGGWEMHRYILLKSVIVLSSWFFGYMGMKHLPLTIVGPINATRPVLVLLGAMVVYGERLNLYQWAGVLLAISSFFLLSRSGKKKVSTSAITAGYGLLSLQPYLVQQVVCTTNTLWQALIMAVLGSIAWLFSHGITSIKWAGCSLCC